MSEYLSQILIDTLRTISTDRQQARYLPDGLVKALNRRGYIVAGPADAPSSAGFTLSDKGRAMLEAASH